MDSSSSNNEIYILDAGRGNTKANVHASRCYVSTVDDACVAENLSRDADLIFTILPRLNFWPHSCNGKFLCAIMILIIGYPDGTYHRLLEKLSFQAHARNVCRKV